MSYKIAQLNLPSKTKKVQTLSDIFIAQPDSIKESLAGKLITLIEISEVNNSSIKLINFLFQQLNNNYYQNDKIILRERISTIKPEHIFETALTKTNKDLENFIKQEKIKTSLSAINISVALLYGQNFHFANTGKNRIFLYYRQTKENISSNKLKDSQKNINEYKISDLGKATKDSVDFKKNKLFNNVISGELPPKSIIMISNETLPEYITEKKLTNIVSTLPPISAAEQIKSLLNNVNSYVSFQSIIIKITKRETSVILNPQNQTSPGNISQLDTTETKTEKILSPSGFFNIKKWGKIIKSSDKNLDSVKSLGLKDKIYSQKKPIINTKKTVNAFKHFFLTLLNGAYYLFSIITKAPIIKQRIKNLILNFKSFPGKIITFFLKMNLKKRLLLTLAILSIVLLTININLNKKEQKQIAQNEEFQELISEIEKKQHQAEASLLYSNETNAQKLFGEITTLMEKLPQITDEQQKAYNDFKARLDLQLEKTNRVVRFNEKEIIANLSNINSAAEPNDIFLLTDAKRIYSADPKDRSVYIIDLEDLSITVVADTSEATANLKYPVMASNESVYYFSTGNVVEFTTTDNEIKILPINLLGDASQFVAADTYNSRYYILNRQESQIYRYTRNANTFSSPYAWIQEAADFSDAIDISIDGHIYVLLSTGEIIKYLRGNSIEFKLETINPPLLNPSAIYSSPDLKFIYILEPSESRLILYDKSGQFLEQYKDEFIKNAKDFAVDEIDKHIYFLKGTEIMKTPATHLLAEESK
jgi:hypothetical protein